MASFGVLELIVAPLEGKVIIYNHFSPTFSPEVIWLRALAMSPTKGFPQKDIPSNTGCQLSTGTKRHAERCEEYRDAKGLRYGRGSRSVRTMKCTARFWNTSVLGLYPDSLGRSCVLSGGTDLHCSVWAAPFKGSSGPHGQ